MKCQKRIIFVFLTLCVCGLASPDADADANAKPVIIVEGAYRKPGSANPINMIKKSSRNIQFVPAEFEEDDPLMASGSFNRPQYQEIQRPNDKFMKDIPKEYMDHASKAKMARDSFTKAENKMHDPLRNGDFGYRNNKGGGHFEVVRNSDLMPNKDQRSKRNFIAVPSTNERPEAINNEDNAQTSASILSGVGISLTTKNNDGMETIHQFTEPVFIAPEPSEDLPPYGPPYNDFNQIKHQVEKRMPEKFNDFTKNSQPILIKTHHTLIAHEPNNPHYESSPFNDQSKSKRIKKNLKNENLYDPTIPPKQQFQIKNTQSKNKNKNSLPNVFKNVPSLNNRRPKKKFIGPLNKNEAKFREETKKHIKNKQNEQKIVKEPQNPQKRQINKEFNKIFDNQYPNAVKTPSGSVGFQKFSMNGIDVEFDIQGKDSKTKSEVKVRKSPPPNMPKRIRKIVKKKRNHLLDIRGDRYRAQQENKNQLNNEINDEQINIESKKEKKRPEREFIGPLPPLTPTPFHHLPPHPLPIEHFPPPIPLIPDEQFHDEPIHVNIHIDPRKPHDSDHYNVVHGPKLEFFPAVTTTPVPLPPIVHHTTTLPPPPIIPHVTTPRPMPHIIHHSEPPKYKPTPAPIPLPVGPTVSSLPIKKPNHHYPFYHNQDARALVMPITKAPPSYLHTTNHPDEVSTLPPLLTASPTYAPVVTTHAPYAPRPTPHPTYAPLRVTPTPSPYINKFVATTTLPPRKYGKYVTPSIILNTIISSTDPSDIPVVPAEPEHRPSQIVKPPHNHQIDGPEDFIKHPIVHGGDSGHHGIKVFADDQILSQDDLRLKFHQSKPHQIIKSLPVKRKYVHHPKGPTTPRPVFYPHRSPSTPIPLILPSPKEKEFKAQKTKKPFHLNQHKRIEKPKKIYDHPYGPTPKPLSLPKVYTHELLPLPPPPPPPPTISTTTLPPPPVANETIVVETSPKKSPIRRVVLPTRIKSGNLFKEGEIEPTPFSNPFGTHNSDLDKPIRKEEKVEVVDEIPSFVKEGPFFEEAPIFNGDEVDLPEVNVFDGIPQEIRQQTSGIFEELDLTPIDLEVEPHQQQQQQQKKSQQLKQQPQTLEIFEVTPNQQDSVERSNEEIFDGVPLVTPKPHRQEVVVPFTHQSFNLFDELQQSNSFNSAPSSEIFEELSRAQFGTPTFIDDVPTFIEQTSNLGDDFGTTHDNKQSINNDGVVKRSDGTTMQMMPKPHVNTLKRRFENLEIMRLPGRQ